MRRLRASFAPTSPEWVGSNVDLFAIIVNDERDAEYFFSLGHDHEHVQSTWHASLLGMSQSEVLVLLALSFCGWTEQEKYSVSG